MIPNIKKTILLMQMLFFSITVTGCWDQQPVGKLKVDITSGLELSPQKRLLVTRSAPIYEEDIKSKSEIITEELDSPRESRKHTGAISYNAVVSGKIQQLLFSKDLAEIGIIDFLEPMERDTENSPLAMVIIVDGSPEELIRKTNEFTDKPSPGFYLNRLIEHNIKFSLIPETRIHNFCIAYFALGIDPIAPKVKLERSENQGVRVTGTALFSDDRLVGEIGFDDTVALLAMMGKMKRSRFVFDTLKTNEMNRKPLIKSGFSLNRVKRKIKVTMKNGIPRVDIRLNISGNIQAHRWNGVKNKEDKEKLEDLVSNELVNICKNVLKYTQEVGSDPIGIGNMVRAKQGKAWKKEEWKETYKKAVFNIEVKYTINNHGVIR